MRILTLVLLLVCSPLHAGETWRVVGDEQFAPYSFVTMEDDTPHGVNVDLIRAIMLAGAFDYQLRLCPWERVKRMLDRSEVEMAFQFAGTPERISTPPSRSGRPPPNTTLRGRTGIPKRSASSPCKMPAHWLVAKPKPAAV